MISYKCDELVYKLPETCHSVTEIREKRVEERKIIKSDKQNGKMQKLNDGSCFNIN